MKKILFILSATIVLFSCRLEKDVQKSNKGKIFENDNVSVSGVNAGWGTGFSSRISAGKLFVEELKSNSIPQSLPNADFPDWVSFKNFYYSKKESLSNPVRQFCSELLLRSYDLASLSNNNKTVKSVILENISFLASSKYQGYQLMHHYLSWMKVNNINDYITIKNQILSYAKPVLGAPNPNLQNDPRIESNPEFKAEMDRIIGQARQNDSFIEKIKLL